MKMLDGKELLRDQIKDCGIFKHGKIAIVLDVHSL